VLLSELPQPLLLVVDVVNTVGSRPAVRPIARRRLQLRLLLEPPPLAQRLLALAPLLQHPHLAVARLIRLGFAGRVVALARAEARVVVVLELAEPLALQPLLPLAVRQHRGQRLRCALLLLLHGASPARALPFGPLRLQPLLLLLGEDGAGVVDDRRGQRRMVRRHQHPLLLECGRRIAAPSWAVKAVVALALARRLRPSKSIVCHERCGLGHARFGSKSLEAEGPAALGLAGWVGGGLVVGS